MLKTGKFDIQSVKISRSALLHNLEAMRSLAPRSRFFAMVKSNAYGHGLAQILSILKDKVDGYGVNSLVEAVHLRSLDPHACILVMGMNGAELLGIKQLGLEVADVEKLHLVLSSMESVQCLEGSELASLSFHLKIDTGLSRLGIPPSQIPEFLEYMEHHPRVHWAGIMTHFANVEDVTRQDYAQKQLRLFHSACEKVQSAAQKLAKPPLWRHAAASAAVMLLPDASLDMVRVGISLYGFWPSTQTRLSFLSRCPISKSLELRPVLTWCSRIIQINLVKKGAFVGYGCSHRVEEDRRVAVIPVGYFEGYGRQLSNRAYVLIRGRRASILGRVSMNMLCVDLAHIPQAQLGDEVTLIGKDGEEEITAEYLAELSNTIHYEIVTRIHPDLPRRIID